VTLPADLSEPLEIKMSLFNRITETYLGKDRTMKEQKVYKYVVTEAVKVKDDNGQIESIDKNVLGEGTITAYDDANAKLQATIKHATVIDKANKKEVKVDVNPFC
jgi:hypothetical protein